jgi:hypothetical protein
MPVPGENRSSRMLELLTNTECGMSTRERFSFNHAALLRVQAGANRPVDLGHPI